MPAKKKFRPVVEEAPQSYAPVRGRGASWSPANRFEKLHVDLTDIDSVDVDPATDEQPRRPTQYFRDGTKSIIIRNNSPDVGFETSLNPYRGCEHGCVYCYARPTHEYLGFSAGLDFESKILVKDDAPELLREALASPRWQPKTIAISGVTDPFQPIERKLEITRRCLAVLAGFRNPAPIIERWLGEHFPDRKEKVLNRIRELRGGKLYDSRWDVRGRGEGIFADQIRAIFDVTCRKLGLNERSYELSTAAFRRRGQQAA